ncbi:cation:proton antiporter [Streptomyces sp. NPDC057623]|uniref:cation:proton antiporter n=1 Tax=Streptomyces sp. NPDC057623 TaxID=3346187 RepID=UPI0036BADC54
MGALGPALHAAHVAVALAAVFLIAWLGRSVARLLRQPDVIGEIAAGLLAGPAALALLGSGPFHAVLPQGVLDTLKFVGQAGLVLFLVGLARHMRTGPNSPPRRSTLWVSAGALVPPLLCGVVLAGWVIASHDVTVRGTAPLPAFVLMTAVSMSISAVPVMARILTARRMENSAAGTITMASAIVIDAVGWLLLTVAISLASGSPDGLLHSMRALVLGLVCALAIRYSLCSRGARNLCRRAPRWAATLLGASALVVAISMEHLGMTAILGAALVGFSIPTGKSTPWEQAVASVSRVGRVLVPAFFVVTGIMVFNRPFSAVPWAIIALAIMLGVLGKGLGGYAGARLGGQPRDVSIRIGVLMNTRGLTELVVLQAGYSAGILTTPLVLALVVMALTTTAMTGPLLSYLDRVSQQSLRMPQQEHSQHRTI